MLFSIKTSFNHYKVKRNQSFNIDYIVPFINDKTVEYIIIPYPKNNYHQTLLQDIEFNPTPLLDSKKNNPYLIFANDLHKEKSNITVSFKISTQANIYESTEKYYLTDYNKVEISPELLSGSTSISTNHPSIKKIISEFDLSLPIYNLANLTYKYVIANFSYANPIKDLYTCQQALENKKIDCGGFSTVLVSLLRAIGIPARIVAGYWVGYDKNTMHAWCEYMMPNNTWVPMDASVEALFKEKRTHKFGGYGYIGSDRIIISENSDFSINITKDRSIDVRILQTPIAVKKNNWFLLDEYNIITK